ncbi:phospholipase D-like domain-containing protein [Chryseobacterium sp. 2TAF14]|uniref:phospholipase D-like domain-containing protein n=1 Tax=Chryseobacterium sp. 2TAF14 TaxID=3233007 RepID=UPI003F8DCBDF
MMEEPQIYFTNIEQVIMDNFEEASESIKISVAWFTNKNLINKLISLKQEKKITVQILVDDNEINKKYFHDIFETDLQKNDIEIKKLKLKKFNHNKFCTIDKKIAITGSYNYTENANKNLENLVVVINSKIAEYYTRIFHFFTDLDYIDQNIDILFNNFYFANKLISTFYPFTRKLMSSLEDKLYLGLLFYTF